MIRLAKYISIFEGGLAGHMAHPIDYTDFSCNDLKDLIDQLFNGKIEHMKEKLDGFNIMATMNNDGKVVFIRNKGNLNSENGGMTIDDMMEKWATADRQRKVFKLAGEIITSIFKQVDKEYFNPDPEHRKVINCECIIAGKTNNMPYASDRVAFHGYKIYKKENDKWVEENDVEGLVDDLYAAAKGIDAAKPRPDLIIKNVEIASNLGEEFKKAIDTLFTNEDLVNDSTIEQWQIKRYEKLAPKWMANSKDIYNRLFNNDKSITLSQLKKIYPDHIDELNSLDKDLKKEICSKVIKPLDSLFLKIGNEFINLLDGFTNSEHHDKTIDLIKKDIQEVIDLIKSKGSVSAQEKIERNLERLKDIDDKLNSAEGIVFMYKGRRMKLTGSFSPVNQILGTRFEFDK